MDTSERHPANPTPKLLIRIADVCKWRRQSPSDEGIEPADAFKQITAFAKNTPFQVDAFATARQGLTRPSDEGP